MRALNEKSGETSCDTTDPAVSIGRGRVDGDGRGDGHGNRCTGSGLGARNGCRVGSLDDGRDIACTSVTAVTSRTTIARDAGVGTAVGLRDGNVDGGLADFNDQRRLRLHDGSLRLFGVEGVVDGGRSAGDGDGAGHAARVGAAVTTTPGAVGTAAVLAVGTHIAVGRRGAAAGSAGTAGPVLLDAACAAVLEALVGAGDGDDLSNG